MLLEFAARHLSITAFPTVDVPPFTIVVGINGSGKSHLLQAIKNGSIKNSITSVTKRMDGNSESAIKLITLATHMRDATAYTSIENSLDRGNSSIRRGISFEEARRSALSAVAAQLDQLTSGHVSKSLGHGEDIWRLGIDEVVARGGDISNRPEIERIFREAEVELIKHGDLSTSPMAKVDQTSLVLQSVQRISTKLGISPLLLTEHQQQQYHRFTVDPFENNLPNIFGRYRDAKLRNDLAQHRDHKTGSNTSLTDEDFVKRFGRPPWTQISETFEAFGLPYAAVEPDLLGFSQVHFHLTKKPGGEAVSIQNLSSGEKVLLQFALSSYNYDNDVVNVQRPSLLLADEMDAPLHPEMVHRWLSVISNGLVKQQQMHCIITTHSPTTVALAPEISLYEMTDGIAGLRKISKQEAMNKLTYGVPTLSIDYSGRRQVFTESDTDAAIYERVYSLIKSRIQCVRELNFLSTGMRKKDGGEINSGCTVVTNIVERLASTGNKCVFGIVDWDGTAQSTERVYVIAEGSHDGIENLLLDPLLICLLLLKKRQAPHELHDIEQFVGANTLTADNLQRMVDAIQYKIVTGGSRSLVEVSFLDGIKTKVLHDYLIMDDHALEDALRNAFPCLRKWSNRGALVMAVIDEVLTEYRGLCPSPLKAIFEKVANA